MYCDVLQYTLLHCTAKTTYNAAMHSIILNCSSLYNTLKSLYCTALQSITLHCVLLRCNTYWTVLYWTVLYWTVLNWTVLHQTVHYFSAVYSAMPAIWSLLLGAIRLAQRTLYYTALYNSALYTTLHYTTLRCTTLQYSTLCNATLHCPFNNSTFPSAQHSTACCAYCSRKLFPIKASQMANSTLLKRSELFFSQFCIKNPSMVQKLQPFSQWSKNLPNPAGIKNLLEVLSLNIAWRRRKVVGGKADWIN